VLQIEPNYSFDGGATTSQPLGYVISQGGQAVAAIDQNKTGAWMKPGLEGTLRSAAGLAASILYIYKPQNPHQ
jgi:hypothetical protein